MAKVVILGHGMVANHLLVGLERIKNGELKPYGVPFGFNKLGIDFNEIEFVASYDIDGEKVGKTAYQVAKKAIGDVVPIPKNLKDLVIRTGVHLGSVEGLPIKVSSLDTEYTLSELVDLLVDEWKVDGPDVFLNLLTTEYGKPFETLEYLEFAIEENDKERLTATQFYAYAVAKYSREHKSAVFINVIPMPLANDPTYVSLYELSKGLVLGDDGATGATPLTADLLEHMAERNRYVLSIAQFNIGGNMDFLALTIPKKNVMKEFTKSSIVEDILGYDVPHYIKPTGYLKPLGDKKFVSMHIEYETFNGLRDELVVNYRINDSPSLAGMCVDLIRIGKLVLDSGSIGTCYPINAFFMKKPGPRDAKSVSKIVAFQKLIGFLNERGIRILSDGGSA